LTENQIGTIRLLVVSREPAVLRLLWSIEESDCWQLETAASGWDAMERVQSGAVLDLLLLDIPRGDTDSLHLLRWLRRLRPDLPVVVLCHPEDAARGKEATRLGAEEILVRPFDGQQLKSVIRRHLVPAGSDEADMVSENVEQLGADAFFVSASLTMQKLRAQAALLAQTDVPVLILGEAGTGKYTVASLIHKLSVRSGFKLVRVNCAEMPEALLEAELFGHESASSVRIRRSGLGKFATGEKGTIFLEEIAKMPAELQSRLLQLLNHQSGRPGSADASPDVRILAASSANLERALAGKQIREDLYYRLSAFTVHVPPLRQRRDEIAILLRYFMHKLARHYSLPPRGFSSTVLDACQHYSWPGNLKELETFVKRYLVAGDQELTLGEIDLTLAGSADHAPGSRAVRLAAIPREEKRGPGRGQPEPESLKSLIQGIKSEAEQNAIGAALKRTGWNRKAAARLLRVSYRTLLYKIEQYHMRAPEPFLSPLPVEEFSGYGSEIKDDGKAS
jgi:two-component system, NtrC family, response regulator AtoC